MRVDNWPVALADYIESVRQDPFAWGKLDCCGFVARAVEAVTGSNPALLFGAYDSEEGAQALLDEHGGLIGLFSHAFGDEIHPSRLGRADVCLLRDPDGVECAAVCLGNSLASFGVTGLKFLTRERITHAWSVQ